jgi:hypothetical protein
MFMYQGQRHFKHGLSFGTGDCDRTLMQLDDALYDGKANSSPTRFLRTGFFHAVEAVENLRMIAELVDLTRQWFSIFCDSMYFYRFQSFFPTPYTLDSHPSIRSLFVKQFFLTPCHYIPIFCRVLYDVVEPVVNVLGKIMNMNNIFYDNYYISQLAKPSLDTLLQDIYRNRSKLIVVFLCEKYQEKRWCGLEFRAIREMIMEKDMNRIMYIRLDEGHVDGVFSTDGYIDGTKFNPQQLAYFINERLNLLR